MASTDAIAPPRPGAAPASSSVLVIAGLVLALWLCFLAWMALAKANPPQVNPSQIIHAPLILTGTVTPQSSERYNLAILETLKNQLPSLPLSSTVTLHSAQRLEPSTTYILPAYPMRLEDGHSVGLSIFPAPFGGKDTGEFAPQLDPDTGYVTVPARPGAGTQLAYPDTPTYRQLIQNVLTN